MQPENTYQISDIDGTNKRTVTLAQFRAELDAAAAKAKRIAAQQRIEMASRT